MARLDVRAWPFKVAGFALLAGACNQMLDIEPASIDPRLTAAGRAGSSHVSATGGASATGGTETGGTETGGTDAVAPSSGGSSGTHEHPSSGGSTAMTGGASSATGGDAGSAVAPSSGGSGASTTHGGGSDTNGASGEAGAGGDKGGPADLCDEYCDGVQANCPGNDEQYRDREQCSKICHLLPQGTPDSDDDSIACRMKYVDKMRYANGSELSGYCHQAGPSGDGRCGSVCEAYCALMAEVCTADSAGAYHFASDSDCMKTCNALPAAPVPYSSTNPQVSDGNHVLCRLFHVTSAAMADADEHCEHAMGVTLCEATSP